MNHYLSICTVVYNEVKYLEEFVRFHTLQGVGHFYFYDNKSTDGTTELIHQLSKQFSITHIVSERRPIQHWAYDDCLARNKKDFWIAFLDLDEFLLPSRLEDTLVGLLNEYEKFAGVAVSWLIFGSNSELVYSSTPVIQRFTRRAPEVNVHVKSIVQPKHTSCVGLNPHYFVFDEGGFAVNEKMERLPEQYHFEGRTVDRLRIHHYHTKSKEEYFWRKLGPRSNDLRPFDPDKIGEMFDSHNQNQIEDLTAANWVKRIL